MSLFLRNKKYFLALSTEKTLKIHQPVKNEYPYCPQVSQFYFLLKGKGLLLEMADSQSGAGNILNKPETSYCT